MTCILTLDIGGSKTQLALWQADCAGPQMLRSEIFPTDYADEQALLPKLRQILIGRADVAAAAIAFAGPGSADGLLRLTNNPCVIDTVKLGAALPEGCRLTVLNDLAALAWAIGYLPPTSLCALNSPAASGANGGVRIAAACGTGFGVAFRLPGGRVLPSEAGHCRFAPANAAQAELCAKLGGSVTNEDLLSGPGLARIYAALAPAAPAADAAAVNALAAAGDAAAMNAVRLFSGCLGAALGGLALTTLAGGGVYLAGGVCQKLLPRLDAAALLESFVVPGPFAAALAQIPVWIVTDPAATSLGAAVYADQTLLG